MSDRSNINYWVTFDHEPSPEEQAVLELIVSGRDPMDPTFDLHQEERDGASRWNYGGFYIEGIMDEFDAIADDLHEAFPDAIEIRCWVDPKYEWLGTVSIYRRGDPEAITAECDADGGAVFHWPDIRKVLDELCSRVDERARANPLRIDDDGIDIGEVVQAFSRLDI